MEDFLYILAGVAYLAYSVYSASQKKKKKQEQALQQPYVEPVVSNPVVNHPSTSSFFDEILGVQNFEFNTEKEFLSETEEDIIDVVPEEEGIRTTETQVKPEEQEELLQMTMDLEEEDTFDYEFSLREAVISSELLNPPYIDR